jgi:hypothetical protein
MSGTTPLPASKTTSKVPNSSDLGGLLKDLGSGGGKLDTTWGAAAKGTYDISGLNLPNTPAGGKVTGEQFYQLLQSAAQSHNPAYAPIRQRLSYLIPGYTSKVGKFNFTSWDSNAIESWIKGMHSNNVTNPTSPSTALSFLNTSTGKTSSSGLSYNVTNNIVNKYVAPPSVPSTADLTDTAQQAFSKILGRSASPAEAQDFASKYQSLVQSYGDQKNQMKLSKSKDFTPIAQPIQFQQQGINPSQPAPTTVTTGANIAPPSAGIAAQNYAAQNNKTQASAQAVVDNLGGFLSMLKGA